MGRGCVKNGVISFMNDPLRVLYWFTYRIQIVCKITDVENHVVHFWLSFFLKSWKRLSVLTGSIATTKFTEKTRPFNKRIKKIIFVKVFSFFGRWLLTQLKPHFLDLRKLQNVGSWSQCYINIFKVWLCFS